MNKLFKIISLFLLIPLFVLASERNIDFNKQKIISKTYDVNSNASIKVSNSYGNVNVYLWDENKISIQVTIKVSGNNEKKVVERLNEIDVLFKASSNRISAITEINGKSTQRKNNLSYEINYIIKIPKNGNADLTNKYGDISIEKLNGDLTVDCKYGNLFLGELNGKSNNLKVSYSQNSIIKSIDKLNLNSQYSDLEIPKCNQINIDGNYNTFNFQSIGDLNLTSNYTNVKALIILKSIIIGNYLNLKLGKIGNLTTIKTNYSDIQMEADNNTKLISIVGNHTNSKITGPPNYAFDIQLELKYGSFKDAFGINYTDKYIKNTLKSLKGYHLNEGKSKIEIINNFGNIQLLTK
ncbi:hypothetical protein [uncultured Flavobacterium sp.]|uniref:hypothetical protein n=1 Tax=uncultured Flavobacterium sp. TaxID=165435 RepID=UPI0030CA57C3